MDMIKTRKRLSKLDPSYSRFAFLQRGLRMLEIRQNSAKIGAQSPAILNDLLENFALRLEQNKEVVLDYTKIKSIVSPFQDEINGCTVILYLPIRLALNEMVSVYLALAGHRGAYRKSMLVRPDVLTE